MSVLESWGDADVALSEQLRLLIDGTMDYAIFVLSPEGLIRTWNAGAQRSKGYTAEEAIGRHFSMFYLPDAVESRHPEYELECARRDGRYAEEGWRVRKDGSRFWASVTITALRDSSGELRGFGKVTHDLTERRRANEALAGLQADQQRVLETLAHGVILYAVDGMGTPTLKLANTAACEILGMDLASLGAMSGGDVERRDVYTADGLPMSRQELPYATTARTGDAVDDVVWGWKRGGTDMRWLSSTSRPVLDASGELAAVVFSIVDVTERHDASRQLEAAHARFAALVEHSSDVICVLDTDAMVRYASPAYEGVYGEPSAERVGHSIIDRLHPDDRSGFLRAMARLVESPHQVVTIESRIVRADGTVRHLEVTAANHLADGAVAGIVTNSRDVTEWVEAASHLAHDAMHDSLTGLANRALLLDRIAQTLDRERRTGSQCALLFIDLDHFKRINDSMGHTAGDQLLVVIAQRLLGTLRPGDTVARLGGDEFVILAEKVPRASTAQLIADRASSILSQPINLGGRTVTVGCSIGISLSDGSTAEALLQQADTALYQAKARGRGGWQLYDQDMRLEARRTIDVEDVIRHTLGTPRVVLHYQPIVSLPDGELVGSEALVRIADEAGALMPPKDFIPIAEATGLIVPLGLDVLRRACQQQAEWAATADPRARISVNLSARQLRSPRLVADIDRVLAETGLPTGSLCLELTETSLIEADRVTCQTVHELSERGIAIALDDFGTGMSSLAHLRNFPISMVKIDRSFVAGLDRDRGDAEVVRAIIGLGRALNLGIVAEGVETSEQARILFELGCEQAQGYLYGRPALPTSSR